MASRPLRFHFDYLSPYAYLAWHRMGPIATKHDLRIEPRPTLLAALLNQHGHKGPAEIEPARDEDVAVWQAVRPSAHRR